MKKVLIAEDERIISLDLKTLLRNNGYEVVTAFSGIEAYNIFETENPDVILMDIRMETSTAGLDTARKILEEKKVPIIFLTAYSDQETINKVKKIHNTESIIKPYSANIIIEKLKTLTN